MVFVKAGSTREPRETFPELFDLIARDYARFEPAGRVVTVAPGQTLCEAAEAHGIEIVAECHSGICGSDPVRILSGREHLVAEPDDQECETLEDLCEREPGECRLACMVRVRGPVRVEIL
jgi:ferredoxin